MTGRCGASGLRVRVSVLSGIGGGILGSPRVVSLLERGAGPWIAWDPTIWVYGTLVGREAVARLRRTTVAVRSAGLRDEDGGACPSFHAWPGFLVGSPNGFSVAPLLRRFIILLFVVGRVSCFGWFGFP